METISLLEGQDQSFELTFTNIQQWYSKLFDIDFSQPPMSYKFIPQLNSFEIECILLHLADLFFHSAHPLSPQSPAFGFPPNFLQSGLISQSGICPTSLPSGDINDLNQGKTIITRHAIPPLATTDNILYTAQFMTIFLNPTTLSDYTRNVILFIPLCTALSSSCKVSEDRSAILPLLISILSTTLSHFTIISKHFSVKHANLRSFSIENGFIDLNDTGTWDDSLGSVFQNVFQNSPIPLEQSQLFTQHYFQLLNPIQDSVSSTSNSIIHPTSSCRQHTSIFIFLLLMNRLMILLFQAILVIFPRCSTWQLIQYYGFGDFVTTALQLPELTHNLFISIVSLVETSSICFRNQSNLWNLFPIQSFDLKLHSMINFPIDKHFPTFKDPYSLSQILYTGGIILKYMSPLISHSFSSVTKTKPFSSLFLQSFFFSLKLIQSFTIVLWTECFNISPSQNQHSNSNISTQYVLNPFSTAIFNGDISKPAPDTNKATFLHCINLLAILIQNSALLLTKSKSNPSNTLPHTSPQPLNSYISPHLFSMILSLSIFYRTNVDDLFHSFSEMASYDNLIIDPHFQSNLYLSFEIAQLTCDKKRLHLSNKIGRFSTPSCKLFPAICSLLSGASTCFSQATPQKMLILTCSTSFFPFINHVLANSFYYKSMLSSPFNLLSQQCINQHIPNHPPSQATPFSQSQLLLFPNIIQNNSHSLYRFQPQHSPVGFPSNFTYPFSFSQAASSIPLTLSTQDYHDNLSSWHDFPDLDDLLLKQRDMFKLLFRTVDSIVHSKHLYLVNSAQNLTDEHKKNKQPPSFVAGNFFLERDANTKLQKQLSASALCYSSTLLAVHPILLSIPFMAVQHNFNRTLFHFISSVDWDSSATSILYGESIASNFSWLLSYFNLLRTFLFFPICIVEVQPTESPESTSKQLNLSLLSANSIDRNFLSSISSGHPVRHSPKLFGPLEQIDPSLIIYSTKHPSPSNESQTWLSEIAQTPHFHSNLYQYLHLPPSIIKQLYYIYTEALIFTIQGFSYTSFSTPLRNSPYVHLPPPCPWTNYATPVSIPLDFKDLPLSGTISKASESFLPGDSGRLNLLLIFNDSYHQHVLHLYNDPTYFLHVFQPNRVQSRNTRISTPQYLREQQLSGSIAVAREWSSALVQHFVELFMELLLNESTWEFVSQIDFSDATQPIAKEYVIDIIPDNCTHWNDKDKWRTNIPANCSDNDIFPLYQPYTLTQQYHSHFPTIATSSINPRDPKQFSHSIYNPDNTTQEQKDDMINYYNNNPAQVPALVFSDEGYTTDELTNVAIKAPTRGHIPYFYNLSKEEQNELYQFFEEHHMFKHFSTTPVSSSSSTLSTSSPSFSPSLFSSNQLPPASSKLLSQHFHDIDFSSLLYSTNITISELYQNSECLPEE